MPTIWNDVLRVAETTPETDLSSLRVILAGGSAVPRHMIESFRDLHGIDVLQGWGMTETSPLAAVSIPPAGTLDGEGFMVVSDRSKDVIKSGGEWISSVDLEVTVMAHPAVFEAAVIAVHDDKWQERPLCCVVLRPDATASAQELKEFLAERVAKWWLPERWTFIESVPKTSVGKFDKKVLRAQYAGGDLDVVVVD